MTDNLYEVQIKNVPFLQAQALYRFLVDLNDDQPMSGQPGQSWSGFIDVGTGMRRPAEARTIVIKPMPTSEEVTRERRLQSKVEELTSIYLDCKHSLDRALEELANARNSIIECCEKVL